MKKFYLILCVLWVNFLFGGKFSTNKWEDENYWKDVIVGEVLIGYNETIDVYKASLKELGLEGKKATLIEKLIPPLNIIKVKVPGGIEEMKEFIKLMEKEPGVRYAEPNRWFYLFFPNDPLWQYQWDKRNMNCPAAWGITLGNTTISIAIIDQGTQYTHPDLAARFGNYKGYDHFNNDADPKPEDENELHGTYCAGIAAATINNGIGMAGVANARLYAYRCGAGMNLDGSACIESIQEAANRRIKIISMSWGGLQPYPPLHDAIKNAWNAGCLMFAASGNTYGEHTIYPAAYPEVIAVGSIDPNDNRSDFSTYGRHLELVAPGRDIVGTIPFNEYVRAFGTSASCPNAAGAAALVWSVNPSLTNAQIRSILCSTAVDLGPTGRDKYYGYGKINVYAAIRMAGIEETFTPIVWKFKTNPNPATNKVVINLSVPKTTNVLLNVYDISGRKVCNLINKKIEKGDHSLVWRCIDDYGKKVPSGIYYLKLNTDTCSYTEKVILMR